MCIFLEIACVCVEKYKTLEKLHECTERHDKFTVESILKKIMYISVCNFVELIAAVKYMERLLETHKNVS